jgi:acyl carrier protein
MESTVTHQVVEQRIYEILTEFGAEPSAMRRDATFPELEIDSLDLVELAQIVEDEYGVRVTAEDAAQIATVGDAIDLIVSRIP